MGWLGEAEPGGLSYGSHYYYVLEWAVGLRGLGLGGPVPAPKLTDWGMKFMRI